MARKYDASHIVVTIIANIAPAATAVVPVTTTFAIFGWYRWIPA